MENKTRNTLIAGLTTLTFAVGGMGLPSAADARGGGHGGGGTAVATWAGDTWVAVILVVAVTAGAATASQDVAVIGADTAVTDMAAATGMDMANAIHITDADTAPVLLAV